MKLARYFLLSILISSFLACNFEVGGGPCTYETTTYPATLVKWLEINSLSYDLLFEVTVSKKRDTLRYSEKNNGNYLTYAEIPKDSLVIGNQYQYQVQEIQKGSCTPMVDMIKLATFTSPQ